jgi:isoaspartyl peptidase/L-asparaginase-like protein (Ntn-hydrolase superfamily)
LLVGKGANKFADDMGVKQVSTNELVTDDARKEWKTFMQFNKTVDVLFRDR